MALTKVHSRMIDQAVVNVVDLGADSTGVTDSAAIIQSAVDSSNLVYIPEGTYLVTESIILKDNTHIYGDGIDATIIQEGGSAADFTTAIFINENNNSTTGNDNIWVEGISFYGKNSTPIADGSVTGTNKGIGGVYLGYCINSKITDCFFKDGWSGFVVSGDQTGYSIQTNNKIENCVVNNSRSWSANGNTGVPRGIFCSTTATKITQCTANNCATGFYLTSEHGIFEGLISKYWSYDNGYYILGRFQKFSDCLADGNNFGIGFGIAYNYGSEYNNCIARGCANMGFRLHAPQSDTRFSNISSYDCGYCIRTENTITFTPSSVTASAGVVTVDLGTDVAANTLFRVNDGVHLSGINEAGYNGVWKIESISGNTLTFKSTAAVTSPATGTIVVKYAVSNLQFDNVLVDNPNIDSFEISIADNVQINNLTVKSSPNGFGVDIRDSKNVTVNNSMFYDTNKQAVYAADSENITIDNINVFNCKTEADTVSSRGAIMFFQVNGISVTNVQGTSPSTWFIAQSSTETTASRGYVKNNIRTDANNVDQTFDGVHYEHAEAGAPSIVAGRGAIYYRTDGGTGTTLYIKEGSHFVTGWVAK